MRRMRRKSQAASVAASRQRRHSRVLLAQRRRCSVVSQGSVRSAIIEDSLGGSDLTDVSLSLKYIKSLLFQ